MAHAKSDKRLLGTWRSDRRRTMKGWIWPRTTRVARRQKLARTLFGHLTLRYTRTRVYTDLKGTKDVQPYTVLAKDSDSVAILTISPLHDEQRVIHIHFEGDRYYWIALDELRREWFKRIAPG